VITSDTDASLKWCSTPPLWHIDAVGGVHPIINTRGPDVRFRRITGHRKAAFNQSKMTRRKRQPFCITSPRRFLGLLGYI
jgi:hypothetical protein